MSELKIFRTRRESESIAASFPCGHVERLGDKKFIVLVHDDNRSLVYCKDGSLIDRGVKSDSDILEDSCYSNGSVLYKIKDDGSKVPTLWWKKNNGHVDHLAILKDALSEVFDIGKASLPVNDASKRKNSETLTVFPVSDAHFGLLAHRGECGKSWDLKLASESFTKLFGKLINISDDSEECIIASLGDFFHYDGVKPVTTASGHILDVDSRWGKMYRIGCSVMKWAIELAAQKYRKVTVIACQGNHDEASSQSMAYLLGQLYANSKRVNVVENNNQFLYHVFGLNLLGFTHGTVRSKKALPMIMAADMPTEWGYSTHRHWLTGHTHQREVLSFPGCVVETLPAICSRDFWTHGRGFRSEIEFHSITFDKLGGEVCRRIVR